MTPARSALAEKVARAIARSRHGEAEEHFWRAYEHDALAALRAVWADLAGDLEMLLLAAHTTRARLAECEEALLAQEVRIRALAASPLGEAVRDA